MDWVTNGPTPDEKDYGEFVRAVKPKKDDIWIFGTSTLLLFKLWLGFDIALLFEGETVSSFAFSSAVPTDLPVQDFVIGTGRDSSGAIFLARASVNGRAVIPNPVKRSGGRLVSGCVFNPKTGVLDLYFYSVSCLRRI